MNRDTEIISGALDGAAPRRRAEERLGEKAGTTPSLVIGEDPLRILRELQVRQVELEMQNAELRQARDEAETALEKSLNDIVKRKQDEDDRRGYARRLIEMEEDLKKKLAAELHDEMGKDLTALGMNMTLMRGSLANGASRELLHRIDDSEKLIDGIRRIARSIMGSLRPPGLDELGLIAALTRHGAVFSQRTGIAVSFEVDDAFPRLSADREMALFRIVQESLTNCAKHAEAYRVNVTLREERGTIRLCISDDGRGFTSQATTDTRSGEGMGLKLMRERTEMLGGTFQLISLPGSGTCVSVLIEDNKHAD